MPNGVLSLVDSRIGCRFGLEKRCVLATGLTLGGDPKRAEQYLQWTDAMPADRRSLQSIRVTAAFNSYERGIAAEAAGNPQAAMRHLRNFIVSVDRPPPTLRSQLDDAKARLARLQRKEDG